MRASYGRPTRAEHGAQDVTKRSYATRCYRLVAIGASAGGVFALRQLLSELPADFALPIVVVLHVDPTHTSYIVPIVARRAALRVKQAEDGEVTVGGTIYFAPPDSHLLVGAGGLLMLSGAPRVRFVRPSIDVLFESVARHTGEHAIGVILTGTGRDGSAGIEAIKAAGGLTIAEDPDTAEYSGMPGMAVETHAVDLVLDLDEIAGTLMALADKEKHDV